MQAESVIFTAKNEAARRKAKWNEVYSPLQAHPRLLGTRRNGTKAYAYDVDLAAVTARDLHFEPDLLSQVITADLNPQPYTHKHKHIHTDAHTFTSPFTREWRAPTLLGTHAPTLTHPSALTVAH